MRAAPKMEPHTAVVKRMTTRWHVRPPAQPQQSARPPINDRRLLYTSPSVVIVPFGRDGCGGDESVFGRGGGGGGMSTPCAFGGTHRRGGEACAGCDGVGEVAALAGAKRRSRSSTSSETVREELSTNGESSLVVGCTWRLSHQSGLPGGMAATKFERAGAGARQKPVTAAHACVPRPRSLSSKSCKSWTKAFRARVARDGCCRSGTPSRMRRRCPLRALRARDASTGGRTKPITTTHAAIHLSRTRSARGVCVWKS